MGRVSEGADGRGGLPLWSIVILGFDKDRPPSASLGSLWRAFWSGVGAEPGRNPRADDRLVAAFCAGCGDHWFDDLDQQDR